MATGIPRHYDTASEAIEDLQRRGYTTSWPGGVERGQVLAPDAVTIDETYRFEGMTDPGDSMIVMALSSADGASRWLVVQAYGLYSEGGLGPAFCQLHSRQP